MFGKQNSESATPCICIQASHCEYQNKTQTNINKKFNVFYVNWTFKIKEQTKGKYNLNKDNDNDDGDQTNIHTQKNATISNIGNYVSWS